MFFDMLAIPKDAKNVKNAHIFINYLLRPEVAAKNTNYVNFANSNAASATLVNLEVLNDPGVYPTADVKPKLNVDLAESDAFTQLLTASWTRFKAGS